MKGELKYAGKIDIPFADLRADPLLILRKLPDVASFTKMEDGSYYVVMEPYRLHSALTVTPKGHIKLVVETDRIRWVPCDEHHPDCNGHIEGEARYDPTNGKVIVEGEVELEHPLINVVTWAAMHNYIKRIGQGYIDEFVANFKNPNFINIVPL